MKYVKSSSQVTFLFKEDRINIRNQNYEIYDFLNPNFKNYIFFETFKEDKKRTIFICNLDHKKIFTIVFNFLIREERLQSI